MDSEIFISKEEEYIRIALRDFTNSIFKEMGKLINIGDYEGQLEWEIKELARMIIYAVENK